MDRDIRIFNRPIMQKIFRKNQQLHLKRLKNIKSVINGKKMPNNCHQISNKKAQQIEEDKKTEIEKQNAILFNRMMRIMKRDDPNNKATNSTIGGSSYRPRNSLDYSRINQENRSLFERLQSQKPTISNKKLQDERKKNVTLLRFMGKYPNPTATKYQSIDQGSRGHFHISNKSQNRNRFLSTKDNYYKSYNGQEDPQFLMSMREEEFLRIGNNKNNSIEKNKNQTRYQSRNLQTSANKRKFMSQAINRKASGNNTIESDEQLLKGQNNDDLPKKPIQNNKIQNVDSRNPSIALYQTVQKIDDREMEVKIIRHYSKYQIMAQPISKKFSSQIYSKQLSEIEGNEFFVSQDYNFQNITKLLQIINGKLCVKSDKIKLKDIESGSFDISIQLKQQQQKKTEQKQSRKLSQPQQGQDLQGKYQMLQNQDYKGQKRSQNKPNLDIYEEALDQLVE